MEFEDSLLKGVGRPFFEALGQRLKASEAKISFLTVRTLEEQKKRDANPIRHIKPPAKADD
ncbi:MAG TPA: hypothetical protein VFQ41_03340 [Candidatus Angelobacter sp.]|nr:hypothetical protein [Candidatus Angelobacter sp.]